MYDNFAMAFLGKADMGRTYIVVSMILLEYC